MNFVTYYKIWLKCYINFLDIVPHELGCSPILANAIDFFESYLIKKIVNFNFYSRLQIPLLTHA